MDLLRRRVDELDPILVINGLQLEDRILRLHVSHTHPNPGRDITKNIPVADHSDLMLAAKPARQVQGRGVTGKSGSNDNDF